MPRYATIITGDDGAEIVSAIGEFETSARPHSTRRVEEVAPGVRIGMVRGGPVDAVAGFGFPRQGLDPSAIAATSSKLKAASAKLPISPQVGEMSGPPSAAAAQLLRRTGRTEGGAVPPALPIGEAGSGQFDQAPPKPARAKPRKKSVRKASKARRSAKAPASDGADRG
ncbi:MULTISPECIES: hypothetical protein [unclassified Mesorhizobium]|uniref:hypothetical protein n=1 Tax=unclassified Mesorhizobium TaxID=325217 RepID=UPI000BAFA2E9|nr:MULTISPECIES: hypothetical protein [unclassified Mesorhizobium]TGT56809.1 hypothetical protein EN813_041020 [Mesorhizobium sp. M00.F.Ca.ET.170.01.1.1]AZO08578.1 hypothetical protein EJ074_05125 [Mesorhizobium sp. M3A.F.Ca.ET.080.04.2.1]PBB85455.1 hypothetical protein CK216_17505 [Mesorhizobium sp. WSM3876]RWB71696.1 MAG: hypothetical protein EOQ49_14335 [Mesorhizobium sp.]RWB85052.1 MAG: hypothetical protein EOQ52_22570 [Mesorhizobium sp.]